MPRRRRIQRAVAPQKDTTPRPRVVCSQCTGSGTHELPDRLWDTYRQMPVGAWVTTEEVAARDTTRYPKIDMYRPHHYQRIERTALLYRLNALVKHGIVERRKNTSGRGLAWRRVS